MKLLFFWSFVAYGMTTIIVYGSIFDSIREWIIKTSTFAGHLVNCVLCTSTWVGFFLSLLLTLLNIDGITQQMLGINNTFVEMFVDGMFTAGIVWTINTIVEFFEESRINK